ncbi:glycoside hydrolase family 2 TIM barrel-domain containing protein [Xylanibacter muris]|uniref:Glycoside hydrolase family 2 protein n=1 Tax=Xylanibacter muris TaxID=2736290 RepID=A0ABX2AMB4_9BACT|nr:glycoside hydrolase family 2 TIM barrel-domain containing protein [Xylanibacter muris]NPD92371.1 glycoside hydrolase family 2 protein [Xylanibacter muris]
MKINLLFIAFALAASAMAQQRKEISLNEDWMFSRDNENWERVNIPHDWAISGPFDKKWDLQTVAIEQNGEKEKSEKSGRSGALPWIGKGYYSKTFNMPNHRCRAELIFDGAMSEPTVTVNGHKAGYWAYGYNAFRMDITDLVKPGENHLKVSLNNVEESSRWYPGGGIYRPVKLVLTGETRFDTWGTYVRTIKADKKKAFISIDTKILGADITKPSGTEVELYDDRGMIVAASHCNADAEGNIHTVLDFNKPKLWSPETPYLYKLVLTHKQDRKVLDRQAINVGVRTVEVSKEGGFMLNGKTRKIKGVCLHHDLGPLGTAENKAALIRQIKMMKAMGCDAIRTAHNVPSEMQMDICDSLGMMVMAESFDMWIYPKCKNGYARFFKEWGEKDIENLVLHHRNHPSIVMWSIGNEIPEQGGKDGLAISKRLQDLCHKLDPSRPVTQGLDRVDAALKSGVAQAMDVPGFNYRLHKYQKGIETLPQGFLLGSETASTVSSRGVYKFPVTVSDKNTYTDGQCNGYDTEYCSWSNLPDDDWKWQEDNSWVIGEFVWTGYDYLGEPTPYDNYWPSRSSYFGICDLAGLPKDRYFLYRSHWNKKEHTIHLLPHWTWNDRKGKITPVYCYTDGEEAELFVNGKSQGRIKKNKDSRLDRFRLRWNEVKYEPGEIKVVAYDGKGNKIGEDVRRTAGKPAAIKLSAECPDNTDMQLKADGNDMAFITVSMTDKDGIHCPTADNSLSFEVTGDGTFQAACNGDATSLEPFTQPQMRLFNGQLVVVVRSTKNAGKLRLTVTDKKLRLSETIELKTI